VAVLVVAYISALAQYRSMHDRQLEEVRVQQQLSARTSALLIEQNVRLIATALPDLDHEPSITELLPVQWIRAAALFDRKTGEPLSAPGNAGSELRPGVQRHRKLLSTTRPTVRIDGVDILVATPAQQPGAVRVAQISRAQITAELMALKIRAMDANSYLGIEGGMLLAGDGTALAGKHLNELISDPNVVQQLRALIDAGGAGSTIASVGDPARMTLYTVQPVTPLPEVKWYLLIIRDAVDEQIDLTLRPLVWQLVSGASVMVMAVAVVLLSTTISLYRGRRRIEALRMEMINRDLQKARNIQLHWLPDPVLNTSDYQIAAENQPAAHISGDFYNWFDLPTDEDRPTRRTAIVMGDVSGHGLPAAFLMATTQLIIKTTLPSVADPGVCLTELNRQLCSLVYQGQFVTILVMVIDHDTGDLDIASAGQSPPILKREGIAAEVAIDPQLVVGVDDSIVYETHRTTARPGDQIVLFTDGVIESTNDLGEQFAMPRLIDAFQTAPTGPQHTIHSLLGAIATHRQGREADDDLTLVVMRLLPNRSSEPEIAAEAAMV